MTIASCLLRAARDGAILAEPSFTGRSLAFPSCPIVPERSSLSRFRFAAPNIGAPLTAPGRSEEHHPDKRERLIRKAPGGGTTSPPKWPLFSPPSTAPECRDHRFL